MSESQFNQYNNVVTFATEWRKYKLKLKPLDSSAFRSEMQTTQYVRIECLDVKKKREVLIYLFDQNSKYVNKSQELKKILTKIKNSCYVILITYAPLSSFIKKVINRQTHLKVVTYRHEIFDLIVPNGPLCYPHRIMSREEVLHLCNNELNCYLTNLPKIFEEDPQCIWIGATVGDVVEIKMLSDISGETYQYRVVVPKSGRIIAVKEEPIDDPSEEKKEETVEDIDEEVLEHIEKAHADDHDDDDVDVDNEEIPEDADADDDV
jgi:DNA-directed RNA polymerase subunit H (RpoH/RPB5)